MQQLGHACLAGQPAGYSRAIALEAQALQSHQILQIPVAVTGVIDRVTQPVQPATLCSVTGLAGLGGHRFKGGLEAVLLEVGHGQGFR